MGSPRTSRSLVLALALTSVGCASTPTPSTELPNASEGAQSVRVPPGCEGDFSGTWVHASQPEFRYQARDSAGTLRLELQPEASPTAPSAAGAEVQIQLARRPTGFVGETSAFGYSARGTRCPVRFYTDVVACSGDTLTLRTVSELSIDDECNAVDEEKREERLVTQQLVRSRGGAPSPTPGPGPAPTLR